MIALRGYVITGVVGLCAGLGAGWLLWGKEKVPVEIALPAVRQADSSLILARAPDPKAKPKQIVPKGATVERIEEVTVQPKPIVERPEKENVSRETIATPATTLVVHGDTVICPPVRVDLTLLRMKDGTHRVTASSPDGTVIGGVDIPVTNAEPPPKAKVWSAGALYNPGAKTYGGFLTRDLGPARAIAAVSQPSQGAAWVAQIGVAIRW